MSQIKPAAIAFYEKERQGIYIHRKLLKNCLFQPGDRFSVRPKPTQLFSVTLIKDDDGDIFYDQQGIFIARTRYIDMLMGGIFDKYVIYFEQDEPNSIKLRPLQIVLDKSQKWY
jgi:hypothetical protein